MADIDNQPSAESEDNGENEDRADSDDDDSEDGGVELIAPAERGVEFKTVEESNLEAVEDEVREAAEEDLLEGAEDSEAEIAPHFPDIDTGEVRVDSPEDQGILSTHHHIIESEAETHFTTKEFGEAKIKLHDLSSGEFAVWQCRPLQWFEGNVLHREKNPRKVSWDELLLDLIFIASISRAESYIKNYSPTFTQLNQFALTFIILWMHWLHCHYTLNKLGKGDIVQKIFLWIMMILLAGLGINAQNTFASGSSQSTANMFVITMLIGRLMYFISHARMFFTAPEFSLSTILMMSSMTLGAIPYIISIFVDSQRVALWWSGFLIELVLYNTIILLARYVLPPKLFYYRLAVNIEHHSERLGLVTLMVLGEIVVAIVFDSKSPTFSWDNTATVLGLIIAICFQWIYYNVDGSALYTHALRRSVLTAILWQLFHFPLHLAAVTAGAALSTMISQSVSSPFSPPSITVRIFFCGGFAISMLCIAFIGMTHKSHEHQARFAQKLEKKKRILGRIIIAAIIAMLGAVGNSLGAVALIACVSMLLLFETVLEEWGRLRVSKKVSKGGDDHRPHTGHGHAHKLASERWENTD